MPSPSHHGLRSASNSFKPRRGWSAREHISRTHRCRRTSLYPMGLVTTQPADIFPHATHLWPCCTHCMTEPGAPSSGGGGDDSRGQPARQRRDDDEARAARRGVGPIPEAVAPVSPAGTIVRRANLQSEGWCSNALRAHSGSGGAATTAEANRRGSGATTTRRQRGQQLGPEGVAAGGAGRQSESQARGGRRGHEGGHIPEAVAPVSPAGTFVRRASLQSEGWGSNAII